MSRNRHPRNDPRTHPFGSRVAPTAHRLRVAAFATLMCTAVAACTDAPAPTATDADLQASGVDAAGGRAAGAVYTSTNASDGNEVLAFPRRADGTLGNPTAISTGGRGTGLSNLGSQGAVVLSADGRWLLVVNAGSNDVSVFRVGPGGLTLTDRVASGGQMPVSVALRGDLVYALNAGGVNNVTGFRLSSQGKLNLLPGSSRPLSAASTAPAQVEFSPAGDLLVVTEKNTNRIMTFVVGRFGRLRGRRVQESVGMTPFGFAFDNRGVLVVSEAFGGAPDASALSSYMLSRPDRLSAMSESVGTDETAACWVVITRGDNRLVFTTNTGSGSVSSYRLRQDGSLALLHSIAANAGAGSTPLDMALSRNSSSRPFVYVLAPGGAAVEGTLRPYAIEDGGSLRGLGPVGGIPASAYGLAAR